MNFFLYIRIVLKIICGNKVFSLVKLLRVRVYILTHHLYTWHVTCPTGLFVCLFVPTTSLSPSLLFIFSFSSLPLLCLQLYLVPLLATSGHLVSSLWILFTLHSHSLGGGASMSVVFLLPLVLNFSWFRSGPGLGWMGRVRDRHRKTTTSVRYPPALWLVFGRQRCSLRWKSMTLCLHGQLQSLRRSRNTSWRPHDLHHRARGANCILPRTGTRSTLILSIKFC